MSQSNYTKRQNSEIVTPALDALAIFYSIDLAAWAYKDEGGNVFPLASAVALITANVVASMTVTNQDFIRSSGAANIVITLPLSYNKRLTIKHVGTQDLTIVPQGGQTIDGNANLQLRGGKKNSVELIFEGGQWWIN